MREGGREGTEGRRRGRKVGEEETECSWWGLTRHSQSERLFATGLSSITVARSVTRERDSGGLHRPGVLGAVTGAAVGVGVRPRREAHGLCFGGARRAVHRVPVNGDRSLETVTVAVRQREGHIIIAGTCGQVVISFTPAIPGGLGDNAGG